MDIIRRVSSKPFRSNGFFYHSIESATKFFEKKCVQHNVVGWSFKVISSTKRNNLGYCNYKNKVIAMHSRFFFAMAAESVEETILHELAHALTQGEGHNKIWRAKAIELGDTHAKASTNIKASKGFNENWMITSGHTKVESTFKISNLKTITKRQTLVQPEVILKKRIYKPTKVAVKSFNKYKIKSEFVQEMMKLGYNERYSLIQYRLLTQ